MYSVLAVLSLVACASAHMMGSMGMNQGGYNQQGQNLMNFLQNNMMGQMGGGGMGWNHNMMSGNMGGQMHNMMGNMGGNMGGHQQQNQGGNNNQGVMGLLTLMLMQNMMRPNQQMGGQMGGQQMGGQQMGGQMGGQMHGADMDELEDYMKWKMMTEMTDMMMVYMQFKEKEGEFSESMKALCFLVNATYVAAARTNTQIFNQTTDASMMAMEKQLEGMTDEQIMEYAVNMFINNQQMYSEVFFRMAQWACMTGDAYMKAAVKMEKMQNDDGKCDDKK